MLKRPSAWLLCLVQKRHLNTLHQDEMMEETPKITRLNPSYLTVKQQQHRIVI